jgi:Flp pilus assembly protein CpaB
MRRCAILIGSVLVVLLAGTALFAVLSRSQEPTERVVVASQDIPFGTVFSTVFFKANAGTYFTVKIYPADRVPAHAYIFTTWPALDSYLNNYMSLVTIPAGSVLFRPDPRFESLEAPMPTLHGAIATPVTLH